MAGRLAFFLALGLVAGSDGSLGAQFRGPRGGEAQGGRYGWLSSLEEGKARARATGKPLLVVLRCVP